MKRLLLALAILSISTVYAQDPKVRIHLTEPVAAGNTWLQPGDYTVKPWHMDDNVLAIQPEKGHGVFVMVEKEYIPYAGHTEVKVDNTGAAPHIAKIEIAGSDVEYLLPTPGEQLSR